MSVAPVILAKRPRRALIIGVTGQDGAYLSEHLLAQGYEVSGTSRSENPDLTRLRYLRVDNRVNVLRLDPLSRVELDSLLTAFVFDEIYNLSGQSSVGRSFEIPDASFDSIAQAHHMLLQSVASHAAGARIFYANSGDCFGGIEIGEKSRIGDAFRPCSPYAAAKVAAAQVSEYFRQSKDLFVCNGFLFNHESPLRSKMFVTRKVVDFLVSFKSGAERKLQLGNVEVYRDWGFAGDYVDAMSRMLRADIPEDFVIATGTSHSLATFVEKSFESVGLDWRDHTTTSDALLRKSDIYYSCGDPTRAQAVLGWKAKTDFEQLVKRLVDARSGPEPSPDPATGVEQA